MDHVVVVVVVVIVFFTALVASVTASDKALNIVESFLDIIAPVVIFSLILTVEIPLFAGVNQMNEIEKRIRKRL